jgi:prevent-host-death family protein
MNQIGIHEAKTHLSRLVDQAARGEAFVIAKSGPPMVKVVPLDAPEVRAQQRIGFLARLLQVPDDFDSMSSVVIADSFEGAYGATAP